MESATTLLVIALAPAAVAGAVLGLSRAVRRIGDRRAARRAAATPHGPPLERIARDLRRLLAEREAIRSSPDVAVRGLRLRAVECALTDVALDAARALGVPQPPRERRNPLPPSELRLLLTELEASGLVLPPGERSDDG